MYPPDRRVMSKSLAWTICYWLVELIVGISYLGTPPNGRTAQIMNDKDLETEKQDAELKARLNRLSTAIKAETTHVVEERKAAETKPDKGMGKALAMGLRVGSELVAGVLVGGFIGWWIDRWLGTSPFGLLIMLLIGMASGFWSVYRIAMQPTGGGATSKSQPEKK
jgi:ATP synthase protein I